uniref:SET domain-containing protein n=1 Tax=Panagrolaimus sp. JU765 TaxID=591449 RepID=A0AC34RAN3_9BILA
MSGAHLSSPIKPKTKHGRSKETNKITDYFPVRRSTRKTEKMIKLEQIMELKRKIYTGENEFDLIVESFEDKGRGVRAARAFEKGEFVIEYKGERIPHRTALIREAKYAEDPQIGSYMYFFNYRNARWCIDATEESIYKGRLINHSFFLPNLQTKVVDFGGDDFFLCLFASRYIKANEELLYDYGERNEKRVELNPWLMAS